jgi:hypothetical protein
MRWLVLAALALGGCNLVANPGKPCRKHEECKGLAEGYCSRAEICTRECSPVNPCPDDPFTEFICSPQGARQVCLVKCAADGDCATNFVCRERACVAAQPMEPPPK